MHSPIETLCQQGGLPPLVIKGKTTLPIIQGGMGVGVSNGNLAGSVAREGGIGTLSSVGLATMKKYRDSILKILIHDARQKKTYKKEDFGEYFHDATLLAAKIEIQKAQEISGGNGSLWLNTMVAINHYKRHVELACQMGLDGIVSGAGLPLDLPTLTRDYPDIALIPILSNLRGVKIVMKKWEKQGRIPDAIILEDPTRAGGHLGAASTQSFLQEDIQSSILEVAVPEVRDFLKNEGLENTVPIIAAGGIATQSDIKDMIALGASGVQMGTRFLASHESGANDRFKDAVLQTKTIDDIKVYTSNAFLPARGITMSGVFARIENIQAKAVPCAEKCLRECAYRDGVGLLKNGDTPAQMCILNELVRSTDPSHGDSGLMFVGTSALKIDTLIGVKEIIEGLLCSQGEKNG